ncbi:hypothetical protein [Geomicrobium sediminis]|uniref:ABC-type sugar transport system permease subunit n=1 Tax=Geomicrobium sediminis TaxID=1347788 RepID=A0ABS2P7B0_9BACL|nr:hypothetical protein [Geomicrobium sediminis]MBM7630955.1 ABC-type sugar transport system permease subunit [Geomicrobium sediminis]
MKKKLFFQYVFFLPFVISAVSVIHSITNEDRTVSIVYSVLSFPILVGLAFILFHYLKDMLIEQEQKRLGKKKNTNKSELYFFYVWLGVGVVLAVIILFF